MEELHKIMEDKNEAILNSENSEAKVELFEEKPRLHDDSELKEMAEDLIMDALRAIVETTEEYAKEITKDEEPIFIKYIGEKLFEILLFEILKEMYPNRPEVIELINMLIEK